MPRLIWSSQSLRDMQRIYRFLAPKNSSAAKRAVKAIRESVNVLSLQPDVGRPVEDMPIGFREWMIDFGHSGYVVRYCIDENAVLILAVLHQKEAGF